MPTGRASFQGRRTRADGASGSKDLVDNPQSAPATATATARDDDRAAFTTALARIGAAAFVGLEPVPEPDAAVAAAETAAGRRRALALDLPPDGLGRLAEVAVWLAAAQGVSPPRPISRARAVLLAADHGIADAGLYPWPAGATTRRVAAVAAGNSPVAVLARRAGVTVRVVDVALAPDTSAPASTAGPEPSSELPEASYRVRAGNGRIDQDDALTVAELDAAFVVGRRLADEEVDGGADLLVAGTLGVGADTAAAVVIAALRDLEPIDVVDRGDGSDDDRWMLRTAAIRDALRRARPFGADPRSVLRVAGGADLAALAGLLVQAALRRTPVIVDGPPGAAAALAAERIVPGSRAWWLIGADSPDPATGQATSALGLTALVDLRTRADDATGALTAASLVMAAVETAGDLEAAAAAAAAATGQLNIPDIT